MEAVVVALEVLMPRLSDQMEEGTVLRWLKSVGEDVVRGDELFEIETDKATWNVEAEADGVLLEILVPDGELAPVGGTVALIGAREEVGTPESSLSRDDAPSTLPAAPPQAGGPTRARPRATPVARRTALDFGVSLSAVTGTGPGGRIVRKDVLTAQVARAAPVEPVDLPGAGRGAGRRVPLTPSQRTIARRMVESMSSVPHFFASMEIDMDRAVAFREERKRAGVVPVPSFNDLIVKACALALREFPEVNASWEDSAFVRWDRINIGVAVATRDALLVPVVADADMKSLAEIAAETRELARKAQERGLQPRDLADGTFTVSNLGMYGVCAFGAVVNPPEVAILAVGEIAEKPVVLDGSVAVGHRMEVTLSADHRVLYGADAARFLRRVKDLLERPSALTAAKDTDRG